jgi:hypothetical protein
MVSLGTRVVDPVTGFTGVATVRTECLYGSTRIGVEAPGPDGKPVEQWFEEGRLRIAGDAP